MLIMLVLNTHQENYLLSQNTEGHDDDRVLKNMKDAKFWFDFAKIT